MYAMTFDMDTETLQQAYPGESWRNAYVEIRRVLIEEGFDWQQGSVYFGNPRRIDAVTCVLAAQRLTRELPWFGQSVRDIRMLRIEENNDLGSRDRIASARRPQIKPGKPSRPSAA